MHVWPTHLINRHKKLKNYPATATGGKGKGVRVRSGYEITLDSLLFIAPATQAMRFGREAPANFIIRKKVFTTLLKYTQKKH